MILDRSNILYLSDLFRLKMAIGKNKIIIIYQYRTARADLPTVPSQQVEHFDGRRHARHAGRPTAARLRSTTLTFFYPPGPKRLA